MIALLALAAMPPLCHVPPAAYITERTLTEAQYRSLERYGACVCLPDKASVDINYEVYHDPRERSYRFHPSCGK